MEDRRCKLGLAGRLELVRLVEQGASLRSAARALGVAPATAHRWWHRWRSASEEQRSLQELSENSSTSSSELPLGALRRAGAGNPLSAGEDQLGADAPDLSDGQSSLDDLEGASSQRLLAQAPIEPAAELSAL